MNLFEFKESNFSKVENSHNNLKKYGEKKNKINSKIYKMISSKSIDK